jgi:ABC-type multidrug transport system ATPase subunit
MELQWHRLGKQYTHQWIFRGLTHTLAAGSRTAITGPNGSGKSTLLQLLAAATLPSEGKITYQLKGQPLAAEQVYSQVNIAAPYMDLIEEFTLAELLAFHFKFKRLLPGYTLRQAAELMYLEKHWHKPVGLFSSGMKQRLKLGLALLSEGQLLLLDEPTTNLDATGQAWYQQQVPALSAGRTLVIASNQPAEYAWCEGRLHLG